MLCCGGLDSVELCRVVGCVVLWLCCGGVVLLSCVELGSGFVVSHCLELLGLLCWFSSCCVVFCCVVLWWFVLSCVVW